MFLKSWSRSEKLALISVVVAALGVLAAVIVVPEIRQAVGLKQPDNSPVASPTATLSVGENSSSYEEPEPNYILEDYIEGNVGRGVSPFVFHVTSNKQDDSVKIEVLDKKTEKKLQTIFPTVHAADLPFNTLPPTFLTLEDLNFDGYADLRIMKSFAASSLGEECYIFNKGKFIPNKELTKIYDWYSDISLDSKRKEIVKINHCSGLGNIKRIYKFLSENNIPLEHTYAYQEEKEILIDSEADADSPCAYYGR